MSPLTIPPYCHRHHLIDLMKLLICVAVGGLFLAYPRADRGRSQGDESLRRIFVYCSCSGVKASAIRSYLYFFL